jgi:hypothetical protein
MKCAIQFLVQFQFPKWKFWNRRQSVPNVLRSNRLVQIVQRSVLRSYRSFQTVQRSVHRSNRSVQTVQRSVQRSNRSVLTVQLSVPHYNRSVLTVQLSVPHYNRSVQTVQRSTDVVVNFRVFIYRIPYCTFPGFCIYVLLEDSAYI